jgi:hypothetical protein
LLGAVEAPLPWAFARQIGFTYPSAPAYGLSTRGQLVGVHGGVVVVVVLVGGRVDVLLVGGRVDVLLVGGRVLVLLVGGRLEVVVLVGGCVPPHDTLFTVNDVGSAGGVVALVECTIRPIVSEPPVATLPFHDSFCAVCAVPVPDQRALQPCTRFWPAGRAKVSVQLVHGSPVLRSTTSAW